MSSQKKDVKIRNPRGFSLIELIIAVAMIAVLAAIAVPFYQDSLPDAYAPEAEAVLAAISTAAQRYRLEHNNSFTGMTISELEKLGLDTHTTDKWTFTLSSGATSFTAVATGNGSTVSELAGKTITLTYDLGATPHETRTYNF